MRRHGGQPIPDTQIKRLALERLAISTDRNLEITPLEAHD